MDASLLWAAPAVFLAWGWSRSARGWRKAESTAARADWALESASRACAREKTLEAARWCWRDIWDHLPKHLPMDGDRRSLAWFLGVGVATISPPEEGPRVEIQTARLGTLPEEEVERLVSAIGDPVLSALWRERSFWSLHEMQRVLLFQCWDPEFTGRKGFGASSHVLGKSWPDLRLSENDGERFLAAPGGCPRCGAHRLVKTTPDWTVYACGAEIEVEWHFEESFWRTRCPSLPVGADMPTLLPHP